MLYLIEAFIRLYMATAYAYIVLMPATLGLLLVSVNSTHMGHVVNSFGQSINQ